MAMVLTEVASWMVSPMRAAGIPLMSTVADPFITIPVPSGITTFTIGQACISPGIEAIMAASLATASTAVFTRLAWAAGPAGVAAAAVAAADAVAISVAVCATAATSEATPAGLVPRQAGIDPMSTFMLPGEPASGDP